MGRGRVRIGLAGLSGGALMRPVERQYDYLSARRASRERTSAVIAGWCFAAMLVIVAVAVLAELLPAGWLEYWVWGGIGQ